MIGKGMSIAHTKASMSYGWNQEKDAEVVFKQELIGNNPEEITQEFKMLQEQNYHCQKNTLSFVLSPTVEDGKRLKQKELEKVCQKFMEQMELEQRQAIAFVHRDKEHTHIHLYVNRIDYKGVAYNDSFIGKRSQQAAEKVAQQLQLTTVKQVQMEKEFLLQDVRQEIKRRHELTLKQFTPKNFEAYIKSMETNGVKVIPSINKGGKLQGFRFEFNGYNLKGSEVHRSMTGSNIGKQLYGQSNSKIKSIAPVKILNNAVPVAPRLAMSILKKIAKKTIKYTIDAGLGI
ncbi:relaxase/mobilization nuclease domain-containing protein [Flagellimonas onchidii]|uniref:relaxase/mobilization nuclease domain-containing protein n=1 Tax=Flagellimonas onchidii TaxID=2562684 RepID=UPI0010A6332C|nr:relaxase/mobilization nuclease domain-containing protein [Allomuricauda onchidii]